MNKIFVKKAHLDFDDESSINLSNLIVVYCDSCHSTSNDDGVICAWCGKNPHQVVKNIFPKKRFARWSVKKLPKRTR